MTLAPEECERVQAAVKDFMVDVFELEDGETEDTPPSLPGGREKVRADVVAYFEDDDPDDD